MKLCTLTIIALLLIGFAGAAEPRINTAQINWTQSLPSGEGIKFSGTAPGTTTGILYSDSGTLKFGDSAVGGSESAPCDIVCYYDGTNCHADWANGTALMIHADNTTAIQAAIDGLPDGGVILLKSKIVLTTSLSSTADISFIGLGYQTGLSGTADPLLTIDGDDAGDLKMYATPHNVLWNMLIETTSDNNGVETTGRTHGMCFEKVAFLARGNGTLLELSNWRIGTVKNCYFSQEENTTTATSTGLKITGNATYGMTNGAVTTCVFWDLSVGINATGVNKTEHCGLRITDSNFQNCASKSIKANTVDDIQIIGCMVDSKYNPNQIELINTFPVRIEGNYIAMSGTGKGIKIDSDTAVIEYVIISGNTIVNYDAGKGDGIYIGRVEQVKFSLLDSNSIKGFARGIHYDKDGAGTYHDQPIVSNNLLILDTTGLEANGMSNGVITGNVFAGTSTAYRATKTTGMKVAHNYGLATHDT